MTWQQNTYNYTGQVKTASATISVTLPFVVGQLTVLSLVFDNLTATTPTVSSIYKPAGESANWVRLAYSDSNQSGGGGGVRTELWGIIPVDVSEAAAAHDVVLSGSVTAKIYQVICFAGGGSTVSIKGGTTEVGTSGSGSLSTTVATLTGSTPSAGDLILVLKGIEGATAPTWPGGAWGGNADVTSGQGATSNVGSQLSYLVSPFGGDETITFTDSGDKSLTAVVLNAGPAAPVAAFSGSGTLEAHKTRYPDLVKGISPTTLKLYYRFNETAEDYERADRTEWWITDESPYRRHQRVLPSNAGGSYTPGDPMYAGYWDFNPASRRAALAKLDQPGLVYGGDIGLDASVSPTSYEPTVNDIMQIYLWDPTMDLAGGGRSYPSESGLRFLTGTVMIHLEEYPVDQSGNPAELIVMQQNASRWTLSITGDGYPKLECNVNVGSVLSSIQVFHTVIGTTALTLNHTHHVAWTFDGSNLRVFLDGTQVGVTPVFYNDGTTTYTSGEIMWTSGGGGTDGGNRSWWEPGVRGVNLLMKTPKGRVDELALWSNGLAPADIASLANAAFVDKPGAALRGRGKLVATQTYPEEVAARTPEVYFRLGDASGASVMTDSSGNARHGSYVGTPQLGQTGLVAGTDTAMVPSPSGSGSHGGTLPYASWMYGTNYTWEFIFKVPTTEEDYGTIMTAGYAGELVFMDFQGRLIWQFCYTTGGSTTSIDSGYFLTAGETHHVACVAEGLERRLYIDGEFWDAYTITGKPAGSSTYPLKIGYGFNTSQPYPYKSTIDEVAIYSIALDDVAIANHAASKTVAPGVAAANLTGSGTLTAQGAPAFAVAAALSGSGALVAGAGTAYFAEPNVSGSGTLVAVGTPIFSESLALSGDGVLTTIPRNAGLLGDASMSGSGQLVVTQAFRPIQQVQGDTANDPELAGTGSRGRYWHQGL